MSAALIRAIERHCSTTGTAPSRFGRDAVNDPRLLGDLRLGRRLRPATLSRVQAALIGKAGQ